MCWVSGSYVVYCMFTVEHLRGPTYGHLIDLYQQYEEQIDARDILYAEVGRQYPQLSIGQPSRFYDMVERIVGPIKPSLCEEAKLTGLPLASYRQRTWKPHIRNNKGKFNIISS